jgi:hypothetical protein
VHQLVNKNFDSIKMHGMTVKDKDINLRSQVRMVPVIVQRGLLTGHVNRLKLMIKKLAQKTIYRKALNDLSRRDDMTCN